MERNSFLHLALLNEYRLPEELTSEFDENYDISESRYGTSNQSRLNGKDTTVDCSVVRQRLKKDFIFKTLQLLKLLKLEQAVLKQPNGQQFIPLEIAQKQDLFSM